MSIDNHICGHAVTGRSLSGYERVYRMQAGPKYSPRSAARQVWGLLQAQHASAALWPVTAAPPGLALCPCVLWWTLP